MWQTDPIWCKLTSLLLIGKQSNNIMATWAQIQSKKSTSFALWQNNQMKSTDRNICTWSTYSDPLVHNLHIQTHLYIIYIFRPTCTLPTYSDPLVHNLHVQTHLHITYIFRPTYSYTLHIFRPTCTLPTYSIPSYTDPLTHYLYIQTHLHITYIYTDPLTHYLYIQTHLHITFIHRLTCTFASVPIWGK